MRRKARDFSTTTLMISKPWHKPVEDIKQDDAVEGQALVNDDAAYESPRSSADHHQIYSI